MSKKPARVPSEKRPMPKGVVNNLFRRRSDTIEAWWALGPQRANGLAAHEELGLIEQFAYALSQLPGRRGRFRVSSRPFQVEHWGRNLEARTLNPLPATEGHTFPDWVESMGNVLAQSSNGESVVPFSLQLDTKVSGRSWRRLLEQADRNRGEALAHEALADELDKLNTIMALPGVDATPLSAAAGHWLMTRSAALGIPAPALPYLGGDVIDEHYMRSITDPVNIYYDPTQRTLQVHAVRDGELVEQRVAILNVGQVQGRRLYPLDQDMTRWLTHQRTVGMPEVEWAGSFDIVDDRKNESKLLGMVGRMQNFADEYLVNGSKPPIDLLLATDKVMEAHRDATGADQIAATSMKVHMYCAVPGDTEKEVLAKVDALTTAYNREVGVELVHAPDAQYTFLDAFMPGVAPPMHPGRAPSLPIRLFATGLPHSTTTLGDNQGPVVGELAEDPSRAWLWDVHRVHESDVDLGGTVTITAAQGWGKTLTANTLFYNSMQQGDLCAMFAPDGQGARMGALPEIAPYFQHIDLTGDVVPGILAASQLIADPKRSAYPSQEKYLAAVKRANQRRASLIFDQLNECLPYRMQIKETTEGLLAKAIHTAGADYGTNPWRYIHELERMDNENASSIALILRGITEDALGTLLFPEYTNGEVGASQNIIDANARGTVVSMQQVKAPKKDKQPTAWNRSERLFFPVMNAGAHLTAEMAYADFTTPTTIVMDEGKKLVRTGSGAALLADLVENVSRKHKAAVILTQLDMAPVIDAELTNLITTHLLGHMEDVDAAEVAAQHMGRRGAAARRIAEQAASLGKGDWFVSDHLGQFGLAHWRLDHNPALFEVLRSEEIARGSTTSALDATGVESDEQWVGSAA